MAQSYSAGGSRQAAVFTAIVGFHMVVFLLVAAGFGPRFAGMIQDADPMPVKLLPRPEVPIEQLRPVGPQPLEFVVSVLPKPDVEFPEFRNEDVTELSQDPESTRPAGESGAAAPSELVAPRLKSRNGRLAALIESCYPAASRRAGEEGRAVVHLLIGSRGEVTSWRLAEGSGFARLDEAVRCIIERLEFIPGRQDGRAVEAEAQLPVVFRLD